jgi:flagellum-specific ATP synthase
MDEPIADAVRGILDGHVLLDRRLASQNHYPPINVLDSISRCMIDVVTTEHRLSAGRMRDLMATYKEAEDLVNIGAYLSGSNAKIDYAIEMREPLLEFLKQDIHEKAGWDDTLSMVLHLGQ